MLPHTSHLLQPLDVSCFSPLKRAYGYEIQELACQGVYYIDKIDFFTIYTQIRLRVFTEQNIKAGLRRLGLSPTVYIVSYHRSQLSEHRLHQQQQQTTLHGQRRCCVQ
jgi:hypothetical protein